MIVWFFSLRDTEEETAAASKPAAPGPAAPSSTQAGLSDGTVETLRDVTLVLLCAFKGSASLQRVTFNIEKFTELVQRSISQAKAEGFLETRRAQRTQLGSEAGEQRVTQLL